MSKNEWMNKRTPLGLERRRQWHPTPVLLPGKFHGRKSLVGCSPWGHSESDTTERLHFHFSLSCTGEGNGNPLPCSCLENPRDGEDWWAASMGSHRVRHDWSDLAAAAGARRQSFQRLYMPLYCNTYQQCSAAWNQPKRTLTIRMKRQRNKMAGETGGYKGLKHF